MNKVKKNQKKGFTLVELMIVVVIMVILAAAATPIFTGYMKKARAATHLAECRSVYVAVQTNIEMQRANKSDPSDLTADNVDKDKIQKEVKLLTTYDAEEAPDGDPDKTFGYKLGTNDGLLSCIAVYYDGGDDGIWKFDVNNGSFEQTTVTTPAD